MSAIRLADLTLGYDRHPAVHHLSGTIEEGSLTAIVGPNGAGKSTLLKGITGTLAPLSGSIAFSKGKRLAYLPQSADLDRSFPIHVYDLVAMGLWNRAGIFGRIGAPDVHRIEHAIAAVGLTGFERRPIGTLSGGQMQRALFARLLLQDAEIILLDEPFTAIDARTTADLLALVQRWHGESRTVVAVLHDIETVRRAFPRTLLLAREAVAWGRTAEVLTPENLLEARRMVEAFDRQAEPCRRDAA
ncbi:zinc ABC transporter ATP-binding protein AztA [Bosea sp. (in: a-proteobacteria)]|uniref:zinc ABC transporter ATP-binding protein AztA n=1 Tax=Bosea sp. (in: a-proteobacteria) TaxID=1871050 RepID=UPI0012080CD3|nr:zinc ABC transporter ATP-binding protein AztA [Bosea sp. (in: a-proteobacteria)]TAJ28008.1 MAG: ABC transporter ATP-binding protein [Bosea sp. (in: a-proteobacteria)]